MKLAAVACAVVAALFVSPAAAQQAQNIPPLVIAVQPRPAFVPEKAFELPQTRLGMAAVSPRVVYFLDLDRSVRVDDIADAWLFQVYGPKSNLKGYRMVEHIRIDCRAQTVTRVRAAVYFAQKPAFPLEAEPAEALGENTPHALVAKRLCGTATQPPASEIMTGSEAAEARALEIMAKIGN